MKLIACLLVILSMAFTEPLICKDIKFTFQITDEADNPIRNASIEVITPFYDSSKKYNQTNSNGLALISIPRGAHAIFVSHPYYNQLTEIIEFNDKRKIYKLSLKTYSPHKIQMNFSNELLYNPFATNNFYRRHFYLKRTPLNLKSDPIEFSNIKSPVCENTVEFDSVYCARIKKGLNPPEVYYWQSYFFGILNPHYYFRMNYNSEYYIFINDLPKYNTVFDELQTIPGVFISH
jgi:hypothetical protein